jgi:hypothetical protein
MLPSHCRGNTASRVRPCNRNCRLAHAICKQRWRARAPQHRVQLCEVRRVTRNDAPSPLLPADLPACAPLRPNRSLTGCTACAARPRSNVSSTIARRRSRTRTHARRRELAGTEPLCLSRFRAHALAQRRTRAADAGLQPAGARVSSCTMRSRDLDEAARFERRSRRWGPRRARAVARCEHRGAIEARCAVRDPGARWRTRERAECASLLDRWLDVERQREPFASSGSSRAACSRSMRASNSSAASTASIGCATARASSSTTRRARRARTGAASGPTIRNCRSMRCCGAERLVAVAYGQSSTRPISASSPNPSAPVSSTAPAPQQARGVRSFGALLGVWSRASSVSRPSLPRAAPKSRRRCRPAPAATLQGLCRISAKR